MNKVIGICGLAGSGKDAFAELLADRLAEYGYLGRIDRFAAPLKEAAKRVFGDSFDDREVKEEPRQIPSYVVSSEASRAVFKANPQLPAQEVIQRVAEVFNPLAQSPGAFPLLSISPRRFQQLLGTEVGRHLDRNIWVRRMRNPQYTLVVPDTRFEDELEVCTDLVFVHRQDCASVEQHESERLALELTRRYNVASCMDPVPYVAQLHLHGRRFYVANNHGDLEHLNAEAELIAKDMTKEDQ